MVLKACKWCVGIDFIYTCAKANALGYLMQRIACLLNILAFVLYLQITATSVQLEVV